MAGADDAISESAGGMSFSKAEAGADLAAIDEVVRRLKQSRIYRVSGDIAMMWGVMQFLQFGLGAISPRAMAQGWFAIDALGIALTVLMLRRAGGQKPVGLARVLGAYALFYAFGFLWTTALVHYGPRETSVFWHTLFLFGYCLAGLWFGLGFLVIGLSLSAAVFAVYFLFSAPAFWAAIAVVAGFGYIACGYWMRRAI
jgi:hypothetical protein